MPRTNLSVAAKRPLKARFLTSNITTRIGIHWSQALSGGIHKPRMRSDWRRKIHGSVGHADFSPTWSVLVLLAVLIPTIAI